MQPQLTNNFNKNYVTFSDWTVGSIGNVKYKRIPINYSKGPLILPTPKLFSFGVQENKDPKTGSLQGYSMPLCLYSRKDSKLTPTPEEKKLVADIKALVEVCTKHVWSKREELGIDSDMTEAQLAKKLDPLYVKKVGGKVDASASPMLYAKLKVDKHNKIYSIFKDLFGNSVDPLTYLNTRCLVKSAIQPMSIFVLGDKISIQVKVYEARVGATQTVMKSLLSDEISESVEEDSVEIMD